MSEHTCGVAFGATVPEVVLDMSEFLDKRLCNDRCSQMFQTVLFRGGAAVIRSGRRLPCRRKGNPSWIPPVAVLLVVDVPVVLFNIPVEAQMVFLMVQTVRRTIEIPQLLHKVIGVLFAGRASRSHPCRCAEAASHGPDFSSDRRASPVAGQGGRYPCWQVVQVVHFPVEAHRQIPMVQTLRRTTEFPQLLDTVVDVPMQVVQIFHVVVQRPIHMVQTAGRTTGIPPVLLRQGDRCSCFTGRADFLCRGADAVSHGPECSPVCLRPNDRCTCCARFVQVSLVQVVNIPVVKQRRLPMVYQTRETSQFLVGKVIDVPVVQVEQVPLMPSWRRQPSLVC